MHPVGLALTDAELGYRHVHRGRLDADRIHAGRDEDDVVPLRSHLAVEQHVRVVRGVKPQIGISLEGVVLATDSVDARDEVHEVAGSVPVAPLQLVLLRVEVLFRPRGRGRVLAELVA